LFSDGAVAYFLYKKNKIPYYVTIRNTDINIFFKYLIFLRPLGVNILKESKRIIFLTETYKKRTFNKYVPIKLKEGLLHKTSVIPNGINDFWLSNINKENKMIREEIRLIYVGEISKNKNIHGIIKAVNFILKDNSISIQLNIVGEGLNDNKSYLKKIRRMIKYNDNISIVPLMPKEKLLYLYRDSDIFIMPSFTETFGLVYAEALSQGLPLIYSENEGFDGIFEDGVVGYKVNPKLVSSIKNGIISLNNNYTKIQINCTKASLKFSWNNIANTYYNNYKEDLNGN